MNIIDRLKSSTPSFFKKIRNTGIVVAAIGASIVSAPVALPAIVIKIGGYLLLAGTIAGTVSQSAVKGEIK